MALHHWGQNYKFSNDIPYESSSWDLHDVAVKLMHIAVKLIGDVDPIFRKACLVGAISFPSGTEGWIKTHLLSTFSHLLSRVGSDSNFNDVISNVEMAVSKNEDFSEKFRWLCHLDQKMSLMGMEDLFRLLIHQKDKAEATFMEVRSKFCNDVVFDDIVHHYNVLLEKYRTTRKQYMNGMLALNCI